MGRHVDIGGRQAGALFVLRPGTVAARPPDFHRALMPGVVRIERNGEGLIDLVVAVIEPVVNLNWIQAAASRFRVRAGLNSVLAGAAGSPCATRLPQARLRLRLNFL